MEYPDQKRKFFPALTGLRAVAATLVFIYHFYHPENNNLSFAQLFILLRYRMTVFFVLSGFVIMYSLLPKERLTVKEYANFIIGKLVRLFPLYILLLVVPYLDVGIPTLAIFLTNITLTKGFFKEIYLSGIAPAWSLTTEITFYCLAPFILNYMSQKKEILKSFFLVLLIGLLLSGIGNSLTNLNFNPYGFFDDLYFTLEYTFFGRALDFYAGIILAWIIYKKSDNKLSFLNHIKKTYAGVFLIFFISFFIYYFDNLPTRIGPILALIALHLFLPICVSFFLYGLIKEKTFLSNFLSLKWMIWLGNGSYGFYLMHTSWLQYKISNISPLPDNGYFILWIIAVFTYYSIEKPITIFLRRKLKIT